MQIRIAEIAISLSIDARTAGCEIAYGYPGFLEESGRADINLTVKPAPPFDRTGLECVYNPGENSVWELYRKDGKLLFFFRGKTLVDTSVLMIDEDLSEGEILLHPEWLGMRQRCHPLNYPVDEVLIIKYLSKGHGLLVHAAGIVRNGGGYILVGPSGAGKSTITRLLAAEEGVQVLSDDRVVVRREEEGYWVYGTPWHGDIEIASPRRAPLKGVYFIQHGQRNTISQLEMMESVLSLLTNSFITIYDSRGCSFMLSFVEEICRAVPTRRFCFTPHKSATSFVAGRC